VGTETWADPTAAQNGAHNFHPPFNRISAYREPGRINLNTLYGTCPDVWQMAHNYAAGAIVVPTSSNGYSYLCTVAGTSGASAPTWPTAVGATVTDGTTVPPLTWVNIGAPSSIWRGLMGGCPEMNTLNSWQDFLRSRRGFDAANPNDLLAANPLYPTEFAKPFRSYAGGSMVPPIAVGANSDALRPEFEINATLLRAGGVPHWQRSRAYSVGNVVIPITPNGHVYRCTAPGTSDNSTEPTWPTTTGGTVPDGAALTWTEASWQPTTSYSLGDVVAPTSASWNGHAYICTGPIPGPGNSGGTEPVWSPITSDGALTWTEISQPLFQSTDSISAHANTYKNPYFRYQGIERLGNLVTTRSNVYAVWITSGYFEVTAAPTGYNPAIYPDGYQLGRELGSDTGKIERHRAFYIFDRTLPVGFQRGQDLNVRDAILLERFIE
jgi:hypothetical protein